MFRTLTTSLAALIIAAPLILQPIPAVAQDVPSYAEPAQDTSGDEQIRGRITDFDGAYALTVRDERGFIDNVALHPGTIINPTGLTLAPGMTVSILGYNEGGAFAANEIDTPYTYSSGVPYYAGHPWDYYGAGISLAFFFGSPGWWHGDYFHGGYHYYGGARYYTDVHIRNVYNAGGSFHGRVFVAPANHGGYYSGNARVEAIHTQTHSTVRAENYGSVHAERHFAGPPVVHGYAQSENRVSAPNQTHYQGHSESQYHSATQPQNRYEGHAQSHYAAQPQTRYEAQPQNRYEAQPQNRYEAQPQSHSESHAQGHEGHAEGHPESRAEGQSHDGGHNHH